MQVGFVLYLLLDVAIGLFAYQGSLWKLLPGIPHFDTAGHFVLIGGLAFFLDGALGYRPLTPKAPWLRMAPVLVLSVAAVEEMAQALSPNRSSSLSDFVADSVGVFFFSWLSARVAQPSTIETRGRSTTGR